MKSSRIEIFALGDCRPDTETLQQRFAQAGTPLALEFLPYEEPEKVRRAVEEQALAQSKLSLAFRVDAGPEERLLFQLMSAVLGGVPSSKLFQNVREKMGLCYYCSSAYGPLSRAIYVESGVETENIEKAEQEILNQLHELQAGNITAEELLSAKLALCNAFRSVEDSLGAMENWYLSRTFSGTEETPQQAAEQVMSYTAGQVAEAAGRVKAAAAYCLKGRDDG